MYWVFQVRNIARGLLSGQYKMINKGAGGIESPKKVQLVDRTIPEGFMEAHIGGGGASFASPPMASRWSCHHLLLQKGIT